MTVKDEDVPAPVSIVKEVEAPSAPSPGLVLFKREEQSDIVFIVGTTESEIWRFPAHSFVVAETSSVFANIVSSLNNSNNNGENGSSNNEIFVHCDPEIFHIMLR